MTSKADFTEAEWALLSDLPRLAAFGAMSADDGDAVSSTRELWAGMRELAEGARTRYPGNALIQAVLRAETEDDEGAEVSRAGWRPGAEPLGAAVMEEALETAARVRATLAERAAEPEAAEYTAWVLAIAGAATEAARTGVFGFGGERVSGREAAFVRDLREALGVS